MLGAGTPTDRLLRHRAPCLSAVKDERPAWQGICGGESPSARETPGLPVERAFAERAAQLALPVHELLRECFGAQLLEGRMVGVMFAIPLLGEPAIGDV